MKKTCGYTLAAITNSFTKRRLKYAGHRVRGGGLARAVLEGEVESKRRIRRPKQTYIGNAID